MPTGLNFRLNPVAAEFYPVLGPKLIPAAAEWTPSRGTVTETMLMEIRHM